ncbi:MAG: hypothetical protein KatS3mg022_1372 [Armatimonadota bacterium]|nr:MAG: hypothetical protein KatS3mg022_1372 [Armatimonadota bacterium]
MQNKREYAWSSHGTRILGEWLRKQRALAPPTEEPIDIAMLVRYCAGLLTAQEAETVEGALTAGFAIREIWLRVDEVLGELQRLSLRDIHRMCTGDDLQTQVARIWLEMVSVQTESLTRLPRWWERSHTMVSEGAGTKMGAFTLLSAVWHRWTVMMRMPTFALARSGDRAQVLLAEGVPQDIETIVDRFIVTPEGDISLRVILRQPDGSPAAHLSGAPIAIAVNMGGEIVPLAAGEVFGGQYEAVLPLPPTFGSLPAGGLPQGYLVVELSTVPLSFGGQQVRVPLELEGETPAWAEILGLPECVNERFRMRVRLPDEVRQRYPDRHLIVELRVTPAAWQKIGEWEVSLWQAESMELLAEAPGLPAGVLPSTTLVRMRLRVPDECTTCA